jgi:hypothetical protein
LEATAIERMRRIDDLHIRWHGYVSLSPQGILEPLRWKASIGGCRNTRGVRKPLAERDAMHVRDSQTSRFVIPSLHDADG